MPPSGRLPRASRIIRPPADSTMRSWITAAARTETVFNYQGDKTMSGGGFHVHGPHDHAVEHAAHGNDPFASRIAVLTAVLATVGAGFGYMGGATQNDAAMFKNDAAIRKTAASNQWNYYQAKSNKQNLAELAMSLPGADRDRYAAEVQRYKNEK